MDLVIYNKSTHIVIDVNRDCGELTCDPFNGTLNPDLAYMVVETGPEVGDDISTMGQAAIDTVRSRKLGEIDLKTNQIIAQGFTYDSVQFSLSLEAQSNFQGMKMAADAGLLTYPVEVSTKDNANGAKYDLADTSAVTAFYVAGVTAVQAALAGGRAFKIMVQQATTVAEIEAVIDNR
jgi:hypothetical protein